MEQQQIVEISQITITEWIGLIVFVGCILYGFTAFFNKK